MAVSGAIIPLYLNNDMINNLHTIIIQQFTEVKAITTRKQQAVKITTPLSNVTCGQYVQGNFTVEFLNEFAKQRAEISKKIVVLLELRDLLIQNNLLRSINNQSQINNNIKENDFIEFTCNLKKNPVIQHVEDIINAMEMDIAFNSYSTDEKEKIEYEAKKEVLKSLKEKLEEHKNSNCFRLVAENVCDSNTNISVPIQLQFMEDHIDYMSNSKVSVLGKVVNIAKGNENKNVRMLSGSCFDYLDEEGFMNFESRFVKNNSLVKNYSRKINDINSSLIEIIPIAMYI